MLRIPVAVTLAFLMVAPASVAVAFSPPTTSATSDPIPPVGFANKAVAFRGPDGEHLDLEVPFPLAWSGGLSDATSLALPAEVGRRIDPKLLDVRALAEEGLLVDGTVPVILRGIPAELGLLQDAQLFPRLEMAAGRVALTDLPALAVLSGVDHVFLDAVAQATLADSVPLVRADQVHGQTDAQGRPVTGTGVTIAILDTGIDYTHPDLGGCFGTGCKVAGGWDYANQDADPMDGHGHGTHVAATAAGTHGVAPSATLLAYKVLADGGWGFFSWIVSGIENATFAGADVISMSLGGPGTSDGPLAAAVDWAVAQGVVVVSAAGNSGPQYQSVGEPAASLRGIAVGATTKWDTLAWFSSRGPVVDSTGAITGIKPDLAAPGQDIVAAVPTGFCQLCAPSGYRSLSGTSMATPHVSGAAALLLQSRPDLSPDEVKGALMGTGRPIGEDSRSEGAGRLDAFAAWSTDLAILPGNGWLGLDRSGDPTFQAIQELQVFNLGNSSVAVAMSTSAAFPTNVDPAIVSLPPRGKGNATFSVDVDNADLADGWWTGQVNGTTGAGPGARVLQTFVKSGLIHLTFDSDTWFVNVFRDSVWKETLYYPTPSLNYLAGAGTYDFFATSHGCPSFVVDCLLGSFTHPVVEGLAHESESWANLTRDDAPHAVTIVDRLDDGSIVDPRVTPACLPWAPAGPCLAQRSVLFMKENSNFWNLIGGWDANPPHYFSSLSDDWSIGRWSGYRDGETKYHAGDAVRGVEGDVAMDPPAAAATGVRYNLLGSDEQGRRFEACTFQGFGLGDVRRITDGGREPYRFRSTFLADFPLGNGWLVSPIPCEGAFQAPASGAVNEWADCIDPADCDGLGESFHLVPQQDGRVHQYTIFGWGPEFDDRFARPDDDVLPFDGGAHFAGTVYGGDFSVEIYPRTWMEFFAPGGGGMQRLYQAWPESRLTYEVSVEGESVAAGPLVDAVSTPLDGRQGEVSVSVHFTGAMLDEGVGTASHTATYPTGGLATELPAVAWARVLNDGVMGTRFNAGSERQLFFALHNPSGETFVDVRATVSKGTQAETFPGLVPLDGVFMVDLPDFGAGAYDLVVSASAANGRGAVLEQTPAFVVGNETGQRPEVSILTPTDGQKFTGDFIAQGMASDANGDETLLGVEVRVDNGTWMWANGTRTWSVPVDVDGLADGAHQLEARAFDEGHLVGVDTVEFFVVLQNDAPTINILTPANRATVRGVVAVTGIASDPDGDATIELVQVRIDDGPWATAAGATSWSLAWDTRGVPDGNHTIKARAFDGFLWSPRDLVRVVVENDVDLVVTSVMVEAAKIQTDVGSIDSPVKRYVVAVVKNEGTVPTGSPFLVAANLMSQFTPPGTAVTVPTSESLGEQLVLPLGAGESVTVRFAWDTVGNLGDQKIVVRADVGDAVAESDEANNEATAELFIGVGGLGGTAVAPVGA